MMKKLNCLIRGVREKNLEGTKGLHIYKMGSAGKKYWDKRLENALNRGDDETINYCLAQQEKCKINSERNTKNIQKKLYENPGYIELEKRKTEIQNRILAIQSNSKLDIIEKSNMLRTLRESLKQIDNMIAKMLDNIKKDLSTRYESAVDIFKNSYIDENSVDTVSWDEIKQEKKSNNNSRCEYNPSYSAPQPKVNEHSNSNIENNSQSDFDKGNFEEKTMTLNDIDNFLSNFDKRVLETLETPEERAAREEAEKLNKEQERIRNLQTGIAEKTAKIQELNLKINNLKEPIKEKIERLHQCETSLKEYESLCNEEHYMSCRTSNDRCPC